MCRLCGAEAHNHMPDRTGKYSNRCKKYLNRMHEKIPGNQSLAGILRF